MLKPAVGYYRMSRDDQETSIPDQRAAVRKWAKANGWQIIDEYLDEGISGDATEKRAAFQKMVHDAPSGKFQAIIVWEIGRLGRFDAIEGGYWLYQLRQAGVQIISLDRGVLDWHDFAGRIVWSVEQEAKHGFLVGLARDVSRGKLKAAREGKWMGGKPPYGYRAENGRLIVHSQEAIVVKRLYAEYLAGRSLRGITERLNAEQIPAARGGPWVAASVRLILRSPLYLGKLVYNRINAGKYAQTVSGDVHHKRGGPGTSKRRTRYVFNDPREWVVIESAHDPLIDPATFDSVLERMELRRGGTAPYRNGGAFVFTGLIRCGKCGNRMSGAMVKGSVFWICDGWKKRGRSVCDRNTVRQDELLELVFSAIARKYVSARTAAKIRAMAQKGPDDAWRESLAAARKLAAEADASVAGLKERLCQVDREFVPVIQEKLRHALTQQAAARKALAEAERPQHVIAMEQDREREELIRMFRELAKSHATDPILCRVLLQKSAVEIRVWSDGEPAGKRTIWHFSRGAITIPAPGSALLVNNDRSFETSGVIRFRGKKAKRTG